MFAVLRSRAQRTLVAFFGECLVTGLWAFVDSRFVAEHAAWFAALGLIGLLGVWFAGQIVEFVRWKRGSQAQLSPIMVSEHVYVDCDPVTDEFGAAKVDHLYSVALCLQVTNEAQDGRTLKNLQARLYDRALHRTSLHIREAQDAGVDLKQGDMELVEVGRVLVLSEPGKAPAPPRANGRQPVSLADINYAFNPSPQVRTLAVSGDKPFRISQLDSEHPPFGHDVDLIISATDTVAREVKLRLNLWSENPHKWLAIVR